MRVSKDERVFQLQLWDAKTKRYRPIETGDRDQVDVTFDHYRGEHRRVVLVDKQRSLKPVLYRARHNGPSRTVDAVISEYMDWAKRKGLTQVTMYQRYRYRYSAAVNAGFTAHLAVRLVDDEGFPVTEARYPPRRVECAQEVRS